MSKRNLKRPKDIATQAVPNDPRQPIIEPEFLDYWSQLNLPLRGRMRRQVVQNVAQYARRRRSLEGVSERLASQIISPLFDEMGNVAVEETRRKILDEAIDSGFTDE